jgi:hypothetical protein
VKWKEFHSSARQESLRAPNVISGGVQDGHAILALGVFFLCTKNVDVWSAVQKIRVDVTVEEISMNWLDVDDQVVGYVIMSEMKRI